MDDLVRCTAHTALISDGISAFILKSTSNIMVYAQQSLRYKGNGCILANKNRKTSCRIHSTPIPDRLHAIQ